MSNEELRELEEKMLNSAIPEDENDSRKSAAANISKKIKRHAQSNPKAFFTKSIIIFGCVVVLLLLIVIISTINRQIQRQQAPFRHIDASETQAPVMEGFSYLMEAQTESMEGEAAPDNTATNQSTAETVSTAPRTNNYYVSPSIVSAAPTDSLIQIGERVYKLPISVRTLEENGIALITLGSQPPAEDVILAPQMRNGCIQFGNYRYTVILKNGTDCTYHDLTVCSIQANEEGSAVYVFSGVTIGSEEASIPQGADRIEQDFAKINTFYYWGSLNKELYNTSGRCTAIVVSNNTGKVIEVSVFNDATVTGQ